MNLWLTILLNIFRPSSWHSNWAFLSWKWFRFWPISSSLLVVDSDSPPELAVTVCDSHHRSMRSFCRFHRFLGKYFWTFLAECSVYTNWTIIGCHIRCIFLDAIICVNYTTGQTISARFVLYSLPGNCRRQIDFTILDGNLEFNEWFSFCFQSVLSILEWRHFSGFNAINRPCRVSKEHPTDGTLKMNYSRQTDAFHSKRTLLTPENQFRSENRTVW